MPDRKPPRPPRRANPKPGAKAVPEAAPPKLRKRNPPQRPSFPPGATRPQAPVGPNTVAEIFWRFEEAEPEPRGELEHKDAFTLLVAVLLSAQSTDAGVNKATRELFAVADTPQAMLDLGEDGVRHHIRTINFLNTKARNVIAMSRRLVEEFGGEVPADRAILETLPGVGQKTASVVLNMAFRVPAIAVDTHIYRVSQRIPLAFAPTANEMQAKLEALVPERFRLHAHHWLILHGRYVCKARKPECWRCLIQDLCRYEPKTPEPGTKPLPV